MLLTIIAEQKLSKLEDSDGISNGLNYEQQNSITERDNNGQDDSVVKSLCERIITLEQMSRDQKSKIECLTMQLNKLSTINATETTLMNPQNCCGVLVWKINEFEKKVQSMRNNPNNMFYSSDFYTAPYGYRFCARISISPKTKSKDTLSFISLHVHMMKSENDYHLDWPFRGCIKISMIHENGKYNLHDKIMTNEKSTAFQRPTTEISCHSFGFTEYANINDVRDGGFISTDDTLTIKLQISIV